MLVLLLLLLVLVLLLLLLLLLLVLVVLVLLLLLLLLVLLVLWRLHHQRPMQLATLGLQGLTSAQSLWLRPLVSLVSPCLEPLDRTIVLMLLVLVLAVFPMLHVQLTVLPTSMLVLLQQMHVGLLPVPVVHCLQLCYSDLSMDHAVV